MLVLAGDGIFLSHTQRNRRIKQAMVVMVVVVAEENLTWDQPVGVVSHPHMGLY